ncbi:class I SAM-dependent methyltransferase [Streptomyces specialis]|uniref:class I SAM-dependent methyltransferase n=1 Tax=Streptomyces specialis TaxID=498367 RepID=UPI00073EB53C|nr:class I SAM-dependent methyltransferase [Streptomyces specialis]
MADTRRLTAGVEGGVGQTALMVAAARAIETHRGDALARDTFAEHFVRAARASTNWPIHPDEVAGGETNPLWGRLARYFGLRTRVFDDFVAGSVRTGARQVVLLGAGLDTRAYRLDWPPGCVIYEVDSSQVLAFKHTVLRELDAAPRAVRVPIAADLCAGWAETLIASGFDPAARTAWVAEGLLLYLPHAAERDLIATVDRLSADGSTLVYEVKLDAVSPVARNGPVYSMAKDIGVDLLTLFSDEPRPDSAADLRKRGWSASVHLPFDHTTIHGRGPRPEPNDVLASNRWVFATSTSPSGHRTA